MVNEKNILLIGRTGNGKSTLANVLVSKNREFKEFFKEGHGSTSETREIRDRIFEINGMNYRIIDTPGIGDTKMPEIDIVNEIVKVHDKVKDGLSQILFVIGKKFTKEEEDVHNILSYVIFNSEISKYTTIVRTGFSGFRSDEKCKEDKKKIEEENPSLAKLIRSCRKLIYVDNQPLTDDYEEDEITINKNKREKSRQKLLEHLESCGEIYKPDSIEIVQERISDHYMEEKEKYKDYGLCPECSQSNTGSAYGIGWCKFCNAQHFQQDFNKWTSGSWAIDDFIQSYQLKAINRYGVLEWIPHDKFENIEYLNKGGFGKIYKANWIKGCINYWNIEDNKWGRDKFYPDRVALKSLNYSQNITADFLKEITYHKLFKDDYDGIVKCHGISQDPKTRDYIMVMDYIEGGSLRKYLSNVKLNFRDKIWQLRHVSKGLKSIHYKKLIHRDFHSGNVLISNSNVCLITDLGLCRPVDEKDDGKIFGVLPYVAPEVLRGKQYTQAADIYGFGIIAHEILTGLPPYHDIPHDEFLALKVCQGLRPKSSIKIPQKLEDLIDKCWDADPTKRPTASELYKILYDLFDANGFIRKNTEFYQQYQEAEEYNKTLLSKKEVIDRRKDSIIHHHPDPLYYHPNAFYTSRLLDFKNLPEPQNSKEINYQFYSQVLSDMIDFTNLNQEQQQAQIEQLPK